MGVKEQYEEVIANYPEGSRWKWVVPSLYASEDLWVEVEILDHKYGFGRWDIQVRPVKGGGAAWTKQESLLPLPSDEDDPPEA